MNLITIREEALAIHSCPGRKQTMDGLAMDIPLGEIAMFLWPLEKEVMVGTIDNGSQIIDGRHGDE